MPLIEWEFDRSRRYERPMSIAILDIDQGGKGDGTGFADAAVEELARRISATLRSVDTFARCGGGEFLIVLPEQDANHSILAAERVRAAIAERPISDESGSTEATVSIGLASMNAATPFSTPEALIAAADQALDAARSAGCNRVCHAAHCSPK